MSDRELLAVNVGCDADRVTIWSRPLWLKSDLLVPAHMTPREARDLAVRLLRAARGAEDMPR